MRRILLVSFFILFSFTVAQNAISGQPASREYSRANGLFTRGNYSESLLIYKKLLASPPDTVALSDVHSRIGDCYFQLNDYLNARSAYSNALQHQQPSQRPSTQYWIGFCTFLLGRDREAVAEFLKIPDQYPSSGMWVNTAFYWAGRASERMGRKDEAAEYYRKAGGSGKSVTDRFAMKKAEAVKKGASSK